MTFPQGPPIQISLKTLFLLVLVSAVFLAVVRLASPQDSKGAFWLALLWGGLALAVISAIFRSRAKPQ